jgi:hypothetical protein
MHFLTILLAALPATLAVPTDGYFVFTDADTTPIASRSEESSALTRRSGWCEVDGGDLGVDCYRTPCKDGYLVGWFEWLGQYEFSCSKEGGYDNGS